MQVHFSPYIIPPVLSLTVGITLAIISLGKSTLQRENVLFAVLCIWMNLLSPVFILHHCTNDIQLILSVDRAIHGLYVYITAIYIFFFFTVLKRKNRGFITAMFVISAIFMCFTQSDYYFSGYFKYPWGYIAKGGIVFNLFGILCFSMVMYGIVLCALRLRSEKNPAERKKIQYILLSIVMIGGLTLLNIPSMNGINLYPPGNFMFIPLIIMGYGVLRFHLLNIKSIFHITLVWLLISSFIIIPNCILFFLLKPYIAELSTQALIAIIAIWFFLYNYYYKKIQPLLDQKFNRKKYNLIHEEARFIEHISVLKSLDDLINGLYRFITTTLPFRSAELFIRIQDSNRFVSPGSKRLIIDMTLVNFFSAHDTIFIRDLIDDFPPEFRDAMAELFVEHKAYYCTPFIHNGRCIALLFLPEKIDYTMLTKSELHFIKNIKMATTIALMNSMLFQDLTSLKDNLEFLVEERTAELEKQKENLEREIALARKIQDVLLPSNIPLLENVSIAYQWVPMLGVGGDFVDIHYREGYEEVGLFICDVSGHGVSAALTASMVKMSLNFWGRYINEPGKALEEMHGLLSGKLGGNFVTACMCCLNYKEGFLIYASAGHPPIIIAHANGAIDVIHSSGKLIYESITPIYGVKKIDLLKGDKIILYTDGVTEARNIRGDFLGDDAFIDIIRAHSKLKPELLCDMIYQKTIEFSGQKTFDDDFTILIAEYLGAPS